MTITTSNRPPAIEKPRRIHITITQNEIDKIERYRDQIRQRHPRLNPSTSLIISEAIAQLVDNVAPFWCRPEAVTNSWQD